MCMCTPKRWVIDNGLNTLVETETSIALDFTFGLSVHKNGMNILSKLRLTKFSISSAVGKSVYRPIKFKRFCSSVSRMTVWMETRCIVNFTSHLLFIRHIDMFQFIFRRPLVFGNYSENIWTVFCSPGDFHITLLVTLTFGLSPCQL